MLTRCLTDAVLYITVSDGCRVWGCLCGCLQALGRAWERWSLPTRICAVSLGVPLAGYATVVN